MLISFPVGSPANFPRALSAISEEVVKADFLFSFKTRCFGFAAAYFFLCGVSPFSTEKANTPFC